MDPVIPRTRGPQRTMDALQKMVLCQNNKTWWFFKGPGDLDAVVAHLVAETVPTLVSKIKPCSCGNVRYGKVDRKDRAAAHTFANCEFGIEDANMRTLPVCVNRRKFYATYRCRGYNGEIWLY